MKNGSSTRSVKLLDNLQAGIEMVKERIASPQAGVETVRNQIASP